MSPFQLEANLRANGLENWEIHRCALGSHDAAGVLDLIRPENYGASVVREAVGEGEFPILVADELWRRFRDNASPIPLIKIDVEGAEIEVLFGLKEMLSSEQPPVCIEVLGAGRWRKAHALLSALGYVDYRVVTQADESSGFLGRAWTVLRGRRWCLRPMPDVFRDCSYEMIVCLTARHVAAPDRAK